MMYLRRGALAWGLTLALASLAGADVRTSWVATFDGVEQGEDSYWDIAFDSQGNVVVGGWTITESTYYDFLIVKYSPAGKVLWAQTWDAPEHGEDLLYALVVDADDNILVHGNSRGASTEYDLVTQKYDSDGVLLWSNRYDGPVSGEDASFGSDMLHVDAAGNAYVAGYTAVENGAYDMVAIKYSPAGDQLWLRRSAGAPECPHAFGYAAALSADGHFYVAGDVRAANCYADIGMVVYDTDGNEEWTASYDGPLGTYDGVYALKVDDEGSAYAAGISDTTGGFETVLVKFTQAGDGDWAVRYGGNEGFHYAFAVAVDSSHNAYLTGATMNSGGQYDILTLKASAGGAIAWAQKYYVYNWWAQDWGYDIEVGTDGAVYVAGNAWDGFTRADEALTLKYDSNGVLLFEERYNGAGSGQDGNYVVELADDGSLYSAGYTLNDQGSLDGLLIKYLQAPCTGQETLDSAECKQNNGINKLVVKLSGGLPGDPFTIQLSSGESKTGTVKDNGHGKGKFKDLPGGAGTATATWGCGAEASQGYDCP
ncbi:MAG: hypothetical protein IT449_05880 [Phycisphaerales bacterium]|nr:hypothetical protein [Phycisphaerales bacterium]